MSTSVPAELTAAREPDPERVPARVAPSTVAAEPLRVVAAVAAAPTLAAAVVVVSELPGPVELLVMVFGIAVAVVLTHLLVVRPLVTAVVSSTLERSEIEHLLLEERADRDFRDRLERALRLTSAEPATLRTGLRAVAEVMPDADVSLLLNVPDEPRLGWQVRLVDGSLEPATPLEGSPTCAALSSSSTAIAASSTALDACNHLQDPHVEVSAVCIPLRLGDRTLGTVSIVSAPGETPDQRSLQRAEWAVERTGVRVAEQRLQRGPSMAGRPDPVTGLPGHAALRHQLRDLVRTLSPFCVAVIAVDEHEQLRYDHGDAAADDALRVAADVLCTTLRPDDMVCRIDGPRFAVVLDECTTGQATAAMERVRESLALLLAAEGDPPFTCSAGIVESSRATSLEQILELANDACVHAHAAGGNRVSLAGDV